MRSESKAIYGRLAAASATPQVGPGWIARTVSTGLIEIVFNRSFRVNSFVASPATGGVGRIVDAAPVANQDNTFRIYTYAGTTNGVFSDTPVHFTASGEVRT